MAGRDFSNELFEPTAPAPSVGKDFSTDLFGEPAPKPAPAPVQKKPVVANTDYDEAPAPYDELGLGVEPFREVDKSKTSIMEGFKGEPPTVDAKANRAARDKSPAPESVMFTPAGNLDEVETQISDYKNKFKKSAAAAKAQRDKLRRDADAEDYGVTNFLKDTGVDLTKGVFGLGEMYVGLLDLTSFGSAGKVLGDMGYDPKSYNKFLNGFQSITRKSQDADVDAAQGFIGTLDALLVNPATLIGNIVESLPGTLASGVSAGRYVRFLADRASKEALTLGLTGDAATSFITNKVKEQTTKISLVASGTEGVQTAGQTAEAARQAGTDWNDYVLPSLAAGFGTTAIGLLSNKVGKKLGAGDAELAIAGRIGKVQGLSESEGPFAKAFVKEVLKEGVLEELPQSTQEKIFQNIATGRPWDEDIDKAAAQGLVAGMGMAAGHVSYGRGKAAVKDAFMKRVFPQGSTTQTEPTLDTTAPLATAPATENKEPALNDADLVRQAEQEKTTAATTAQNEKLDARVEQLRSRGASAGTAERIAKRELGIVEEQPAAPAAEQGFVPDFTNWTGAGLTSTLEQQQGKPEDKQNKPLIEAVQAEIQKRAATQGAENAGQTTTDTGGTSVPVAEQPDTNAPAAGLGVADTSGVVPAEQDVAGVAGGEAAQPVAVTEFLKLPEAQLGEPAMQVQDGARQPVPMSALTTPEAIERAGKVLGGNTPEEVVHNLNLANQRGGLATWEVETILGLRDQNQQTISAPVAEEEAPAEEQVTPEETEEDYDQRKQGEYQDAINAGYDALEGNVPAKEKKKTGPKGERLTPEQKAARAEDRKATDALAKKNSARFERNKSNLQTQLDRANERLTEVKASIEAGEVESEKAAETALEERTKEKERVVGDMMDIEAQHRGSPLGNRVKAVLNDRNKISQAEFDKAKKAHEARKKVASGQNPLASRNVVSKGKPNTAFNKATNAAQALNIIAKSGNLFQRFLAKRLRAFVGGVKFVVLEKGDAIPEELQKHADLWETADGLYAPDSRTVYVRGASFGDAQGINNITTLHEILHAATNQKISLALLPGAKRTNPKLTRFVNDLIQVGLYAGKQYELRKSIGLIPKDLLARVESTLREDGTYGIFEEPHEFLAYGMSDEVFQEFLGGVKSILPQETGFMAFVRTLYDEWAKVFGRDAQTLSAMSDLINVTGKVLYTAKTPSMRLVEQGMPSTPLAATRPTGKTTLPPPTPPVGPDERTQAQLDKDVQEALKGVALSENATEMGNAVSALTAARNPSVVWDSYLAPVWDGLTDTARSIFSNFYDADGIARNIGRHVNGLKQTYDAMQRMNGMEKALLVGVSKQSEQMLDFFRKHRPFREQFTKLVLASTNAEYDPSDTTHVVRNNTLDTMYNTLPDEGQKMYRDHRDFWKDLNAIAQDIQLQQIERLGLPKAETDKLMAGIRAIYEKEGKIEPYFPLLRFGDFKLQYGKKGDYVSTHYETNRQRKRALRDLAKRRGQSVEQLINSGYAKTTDDVNGASMRKNIESTSKMLKLMYDAIDAADPTSTTDSLRQQLKDQAYQAYLAAMPENSVRKLFMHRKGTPGYSVDLLRNTNELGLRMARQFSRYQHAPEIQRELEVAGRSLQGKEQYTAFVQRMTGLAAQMISPAPKTWVDTFANSITKLSFYQSLTTLSSAILQPLEILTKGTSVMWGNHGVKGLGYMVKNLNVFNTFGVKEFQADGTWKFRAPSLEHASGLSADERDAMREIMGVYGATGSTILHGIVNDAKGRKPLPYRAIEAVTGKTVVGNKAIDLMDAAVHNLVFGGTLSHADRMSREYIALSAYQASRAEGMTKQEAVEATIAQIYETFGNYDTYNRPLWMQSGAGRMMGLYRFFPLVTFKLLGNNFKEMIPGLNKEGKEAAAKKFFGTVGMTYLLGGAVALPMFSVIMGITGKLWNWFGKDPDAPDDMKEIDYKLWWRTKYIPELLGNMGLGYLTDAFLNGALNQVTGSAISDRISLNDMLFKDVEPGETPTETVMNYAKAFAGAIPSGVVNNIKGVQSWIKGDYQAGFEGIFPASLGKLSVASRMDEEGAKTAEGVRLTDPGMMPKSMIAGQAIGFRPAPVAKAQENVAAVNAGDKQLDIQKRNLSKELAETYRKSEDDTLSKEDRAKWNDKFQMAIQKVIEFSERNPEREFKDADITHFIDAALGKIENKTEHGGIEAKDKTYRWAEPAIEANKKMLAPYRRPEAPPVAPSEGRDHSTELFGK